MGEIDPALAAIIEGRVGRSVCGGRYSIEHVIGIGGMAAVYAGLHRNGRPVAMKFLHPELSRRADIRKRFVREGQAANAVQHPGVVAVIDDDVAEDGSAFLVMERLEGKSLEALWEELGRRFPTRAALPIIRDLCDVLVVAHRAGIYHRDLKPENLFLTDDGRLKVLDFGLAHVRDAARPKDTHTGMVFGTPAFMPPEQASGQTSKIDARTDLWAVGATLFTLLSGELVHQGETAQHFVVLAAMEPARSLAEVMPLAHPCLVQIVDRALCREKEARWQTAESLREAICAAMDLLLGGHEASLPTPAALAELTSRSRPRIAPLAKATSTLDELTEPKVIAIHDEDTLDDHTRVDTKLEAPSESDPRPDARAIKPMSPGSSDTPTDRTGADDLPTQIKTFDPPTLKRPSERNPVDPGKRASWSQLERAIAESPSRQALLAAPVNAETQQLLQTPPSDRTQLLGRDYRPTPGRIPIPTAPEFAASRARSPAAARVPRAAQRTQSKSSTPSGAITPYIPWIGASILVGLSPLAYVLARDCNDGANAQPKTSVSASSGFPRRVVASGSVRAPVVAVSVETAAPAPSDGGAVDCSTPFFVDEDGIKHPKPECF